MSDIAKELRQGRYYVASIASLDETDVCSRAADVIEAQAVRIAELEAQSVKVKPMKWKEDKLSYWRSNHYTLKPARGKTDHWVVFKRDKVIRRKSIHGLDKAKAFVQKRFSHFIMSHIDFPSAHKGVE